MNITEIVTVSPINPALGRHEVHARTNESLDVTFTISPVALGCLTAYYDSFIPSDAAYAKHTRAQQKTSAQNSKQKGS